MPPRHAPLARVQRCAAFTIVELLVVITIIIVLLAFLLVGLSAVRTQGVMATSMKRLSQVGHWMTLYSTDYRETILPSQFDYSGNSYPGKVRSVITPGVGAVSTGTWSDILWTLYANQKYPEGVTAPGIGHNYEFDSPDKALHDYLGGDIDDPMRSAAANTKDMANVPADSVALPFGAGAAERGAPGYYAANNFFNSVANGFFGLGQIKLPAKSLYLVDSFAGELIEDDCPAWAFDNADPAGDPPATGQVDFRYSGEALILFLDSHVASAGQWQNLDELENDRRIKVRNLDSNTPPLPCP